MARRRFAARRPRRRFTRTIRRRPRRRTRRTRRTRETVQTKFNVDTVLSLSNGTRTHAYSLNAGQITEQGQQTISSFNFYKINAVKVVFTPQTRYVSVDTTATDPNVVGAVLPQMLSLFEPNPDESYSTTDTENMINNSRTKFHGLNSKIIRYSKLTPTMRIGMGATTAVDVRSMRSPWISTGDLSAVYGRFVVGARYPTSTTLNTAVSFFVRITYYVSMKQVVN